MSQYRYPGARSYSDTEAERRLFFGRDNDSAALLHAVLAEKLMVVYGKSGTGKTSLLNCGLVQPLRERGFFPITARLNDPRLTCHEAIVRASLDAVEDLGLELDPETREACDNGGWESLWLFFKALTVWKDDDLLTPVLIVDQFEELFSLRHDEDRQEFIQQLSDLVRGRPPQDIEPDDLERFGSSPPELHIVLSMREDYLGQLDELAGKIPSIMASTFKVRPLSE